MPKASFRPYQSDAMTPYELAEDVVMRWPVPAQVEARLSLSAQYGGAVSDAQWAASSPLEQVDALATWIEALRDDMSASFYAKLIGPELKEKVWLGL